VSAFEFDGATVAFEPGMSVAAALWASGRHSWRVTDRGQRQRGYYCGDGFCYDCLVTLDGRPGVRACQTAAERGMRVATQVGFGVA